MMECKIDPGDLLFLTVVVVVHTFPHILHVAVATLTLVKCIYTLERQR